jgi:aromatic ring-opening dioxygenase LigB subunit
LTVTKQRRLTKSYLDQKLKELKETYKSNGELTARLFELSKIIKVNEVNLNIDSLTGTKNDAKVAGIILAEVHIVERIEILADKTDPLQIDKLYQLLARIKARVGKDKDEGQVTKKVS